MARSGHRPLKLPYFLEPHEELGDPLFRAGTVRDHLVSAKMAAADVVCFDVFDTLVTRALIHPRAVWSMMERELDVDPALRVVAPRIAAGGGLPALRRRAADQAMERARARGLQEITLAEIYEELGALTQLGDGAVRALMALELSIERTVHRPRPEGIRLFEEARRLGKRTVLVSDMYLDRAFIEELLARSGVRGYDAIYVSSEHRLLKRTGDLFERVRAEQGSSRRYLHIGDNLHSDVWMPESRGFASAHLRGPTERYRSAWTTRQLWSDPLATKSVGSMVHHGLVSRKHELPPADGSWCGGSAHRLGYEAGGPVFLAFVRWLVETAQRDRIDRLFFLARDGHVVKQVYDLARAGRDDLPESRYLLASRRAYSTAALETADDIVETLSMRFASVSVRDLLRHRFGIDEGDLAPGSGVRAGFRDLDEIVDARRHRDVERLTRLVRANATPILAAAAAERRALLRYLAEEGLDARGSRAVVDIGHNATLQAALGRLVGDRRLAGYYFATFAPARRTASLGHPVSGYLLSFEDPELSSHPYTKNVGMFELLFLPPIPSFVRFREERGALVPEYVEGDESARFALVSELHRGALDFCREALDVCRGRIETFDITPDEALRRYLAFVAEPHREDARLLSGVRFVDAFGGSTSRYLIATPLLPSDGEDADEYVRASWWKAGARALVERPRGRRLETWRGSFRRKLKKLSESPRQFVLDMRVLRALSGMSRSPGRAFAGQRKLQKLLRDPVRFVLDARLLATIRLALARITRNLGARDGQKEACSRPPGRACCGGSSPSVPQTPEATRGS